MPFLGQQLQQEHANCPQLQNTQNLERPQHVAEAERLCHRRSAPIVAKVVIGTLAHPVLDQPGRIDQLNLAVERFAQERLHRVERRHRKAHDVLFGGPDELVDGELLVVIGHVINQAEDNADEFASADFVDPIGEWPLVGEKVRSGRGVNTVLRS